MRIRLSKGLSVNITRKKRNAFNNCVRTQF